MMVLANIHIIACLENRFHKLNDRHSYYTSQNISQRKALMEEMYALGLHFTREHEMYYSCNNLVMLVIVASHCPYTNQSK